MIERSERIEGIRVDWIIEDRDAHEGCSLVNGEWWCSSPGPRFRMVATCVIGGQRMRQEQFCDLEEDFTQLEVRMAAAVRRLKTGLPRGLNGGCYG
jgi:hypothetical protein